MPSIFNLITGTKQKRLTLLVGQEVDTAKELLVVDATLNETHLGNVEITENPIEQGNQSASISDHADIKPEQFTFEGVISNAPIKLEQAIIGNVAGVVGGAIGKAANQPVLGAVATGSLATLGGNLLGQDSGNRVRDGYNTLKEAKDNATPLIVVSGLRTYTNMMIESLSVPRNSGIGDSLRFNISMREVRLVQSQVVKLPAEAVAAAVAHSAGGQTDLGKQPAEEADESFLDKLKQKSILKIAFS